MQKRKSLTEGSWEKTIPQDLASAFRSAINSDAQDRLVAVRDSVNNIINWITDNVPDSDMSFQDIVDQFSFIDLDNPDDFNDPDAEDSLDSDEDPETNEDAVNDILSDFYDLLDSYHIWLPVEESLTEAESDYIKIGGKLYPKNASSFGYDSPENVSAKARQMRSKEIADEEAAKAEKEKQELLAKNKALIDKLKNEDDIELWFEELVPASGVAETKAGELIRAMMRILYRDSNDGDRFFSGYGVETAGPAAQFIHDNTDSQIANEIEDIAGKNLEESSYTDAINDLSYLVMEYIKNHPELIVTKNDDDIFKYDFDTDYIATYDYSCELPDSIRDCFDDDLFTPEDLEEEIQDWGWEDDFSREHGSIEVDRNYLNIENISEDAYNELDQSMPRNLEVYGEETLQENEDTDVEDEDLEEDTIRRGNKWMNKGSEGTHGKFRTKKAADAQRRAMFANGYKGD